MNGYILIFLGAGIGGALRHGVNSACARACGTSFPWGTLAVNVVGSCAMGLLAGWLAVHAAGQSAHPLRLFFGTGILGGFTTFSAFSLDAVVLWQRGEMWIALAYILASIVVSIAGLFLGLALARSLP